MAKVKYINIRVRKDDAVHVRAFIKERQDERTKAIRSKQCVKRLQDFWNARLDYINADIRRVRGDAGINHGFSWTQLVVQELTMWAAIAKPVTYQEYRLICKRRGFTTKQRKFIRDALKYAGLKGW